MSKDIAVFVNENGKAASLDEPGKIAVYRKAQGKWEVLREQSFCLDKGSGIGGLRKSMAEALSFLGDCRIFAGLSVVGVPYFEFEKARYSVWEFEGKPEEFLNYILEQEDKSQEQQTSQAANLIPLPVETSPGCYQISLKEIQRNNSGITSKQVLLPFLRKAEFYSLEVLCSHVPPWLEAELISGNLTGQVCKVSNDEVKVSIGKSCCSLD